MKSNPLWVKILMSCFSGLFLLWGALSTIPMVVEEWMVCVIILMFVVVAIATASGIWLWDVPRDKSGILGK